MRRPRSHRPWYTSSLARFVVLTFVMIGLISLLQAFPQGQQLLDGLRSAVLNAVQIVPFAPLHDAAAKFISDLYDVNLSSNKLMAGLLVGVAALSLRAYWIERGLFTLIGALLLLSLGLFMAQEANLLTALWAFGAYRRGHREEFDDEHEFNKVRKQQQAQQRKAQREAKTQNSKPLPQESAPVVTPIHIDVPNETEALPAKPQPMTPPKEK